MACDSPPTALQRRRNLFQYIAELPAISMMVRLLMTAISSVCLKTCISNLLLPALLEYSQHNWSTRSIPKLYRAVKLQHCRVCRAIAWHLLNTMHCRKEMNYFQYTGILYLDREQYAGWISIVAPYPITQLSFLCREGIGIVLWLPLMVPTSMGIVPFSFFARCRLVNALSVVTRTSLILGLEVFLLVL